MTFTTWNISLIRWNWPLKPPQRGQTAVADPAAAGQATDVDPSATAGQATEVDPSAADGQVAPAGGQSAPYGPLMADGVPVPGVMLSADGGVALFQFQFTVRQTSLPSSVPDDVIKVVTEVEQAGSGITAIPSDSLKSTPAIGSTEAIGVAVAAVVLFITLGSIVAAGRASHRTSRRCDQCWRRICPL